MLPYRKISSMKKKNFLFQLRIELIGRFSNASNVGESLLNSTIELIDHFPMCYAAVKQQLQEEHIKGRESVLVSRTMMIEKQLIHRREIIYKNQV